MCRPASILPPPWPASRIGKILVVVTVTVADRAAVADHRVVQQVPIDPSGVAFSFSSK